MGKKSKPLVADPFAKREAEKYSNPIPSREYILDYLKKCGHPIKREELFQVLGLNKGDSEQEEALRRRFLAIHFGPKELKELLSPSTTASGCQARNLKLTSLLSKFVFSPLNGSSYKLPNFRLFLNKLSSKSSSALASSAITNGLLRPARTNPTRFRPFAKSSSLRSYWAILLVLLNFNVLCEGAVRKATLYTAGFFPLSGEKADLGLGILPAVQLALDDITENDVIPGYKLDLVGNDTMVSRPSLSLILFCGSFGSFCFLLIASLPNPIT